MSDETQMIASVRDEMRKRMKLLPPLDYGAPADLFPCRNKNRQVQFKYRRFETAAEAIRFAIEDIPSPALVGAWLQVDEMRFGSREIRYLYEDASYPLTHC